MGYLLQTVVSIQFYLQNLPLFDWVEHIKNALNSLKLKLSQQIKRFTLTSQLIVYKYKNIHFHTLSFSLLIAT